MAASVTVSQLSAKPSRAVIVPVGSAEHEVALVVRPGVPADVHAESEVTQSPSVLIEISGHGHFWAASPRSPGEVCSSDLLTVKVTVSQSISDHSSASAGRKADIHESKRPVATAFVAKAIHFFRRQCASFNAFHLGKSDLQQWAD